MVYITEEQQAALKDHPQGIRCEIVGGQETYVIVKQSTYDEAMAAIEKQETLEAIREGMADIEAGRFMPLAEAFAEVRKELEFPPRG